MRYGVWLWILLAFIGGMAVERARSQPKPRMWAEVILSVSTDEIPKRTHIKAHLDHWQPGAETGVHSHPGPTLLVMLDGELEEIFGDGRTRTLKPGQAFWNHPRTKHNVRNRSSQPARALAVHLDPDS